MQDRPQEGFMVHVPPLAACLFQTGGYLKKFLKVKLPQNCQCASLVRLLGETGPKEQKRNKKPNAIVWYLFLLDLVLPLVYLVVKLPLR